jgi:hypothetical protein
VVEDSVGAEVVDGAGSAAGAVVEVGSAAPGGSVAAGAKRQLLLLPQQSTGHSLAHKALTAPMTVSAYSGGVQACLEQS